MPGDRLVFGEDPDDHAEQLAKQEVPPIERIGGIVSLAVSTLKAIDTTPGGAKLVKDLVSKNLITDDERLKHTILDAIPDSDRSKKPAAKTKGELKPREKARRRSGSMAGQ